MATETETVKQIREEYKYGFSNPDEAKDYFFKSGRGISHEVVEAIAEHKAEPDGMRKFRHKSQEDLTKQGVLFLDMDSGLREHEDLVKQYFGTIIPQNDNKFAALNSAVWSGGSFIYVPPGVHIEMPLQAYFRINAENMGQF